MKLQSLLGSPDGYLQSFDQGDAVIFGMDRDAFARSIFLDRRIVAKDMNYRRTPLADLLASVDFAPEPAPISYIFHIAHCGSTLLARALDLKDQNLVLREPYILRQLGVDAANGGAFERKVRLARTLLARRYNPAGPVIAKANVPVNFMIPSLMGPQAEQPAIFLHYGLEDYLLAILRSPMHRNWVRHVSNELAPGIEKLTGPRAEAEGEPVAAARLWLTQMLQFEAALAAYPNARSLSAEALFESPKPVLTSAFDLFGQPQSVETIEAIVSSDLFSRYSKDPRHQFDNKQRTERREKLKVELAAELEAGRSWAHTRAGALPARLAKPLVGDGTALLT